MTYFQKRFTSSLNIRLRAVSRMLAAAVFACGALESRAELGLAREAYGVWDRTGFSTVAQYPFTRGQAYSETWFEVNNARNSFQWEALDAQLAFAEDQNQQFNIQISTVGGAPGASVPSWMLDVNGGDVPSLTDGTWQKQFFQLNIRMNMYWTAVEQLHPGMSVWDATGACLNNTYIDDFAFAFEFFNKWSAELIPATAGGGFCILHEGLDSSDTDEFPENSPFGGTANQCNGVRYTRICESKSAQSALMGQEEAAT